MSAGDIVVNVHVILSNTTTHTSYLTSHSFSIRLMHYCPLVFSCSFSLNHIRLYTWVFIHKYYISLICAVWTTSCHVVIDHTLFSSSRVFVNRSLAMEKIKCFGFDMDYTLAGKCSLSLLESALINLWRSACREKDVFTDVITWMWTYFRPCPSLCLSLTKQLAQSIAFSK